MQPWNQSAVWTFQPLIHHSCSTLRCTYGLDNKSISISTSAAGLTFGWFKKRKCFRLFLKGILRTFPFLIFQKWCNTQLCRSCMTVSDMILTWRITGYVQLFNCMLSVSSLSLLFRRVLDWSKPGLLSGLLQGLLQLHSRWRELHLPWQEVWRGTSVCAKTHTHTHNEHFQHPVWDLMQINELNFN